MDIDQDVVAQREALAVTSNDCLPHMLSPLPGPFGQPVRIPVIILDALVGVDELGWPHFRVVVPAPDTAQGFEVRTISSALLVRAR